MLEGTTEKDSGRRVEGWEAGGHQEGRVGMQEQMGAGQVVEGKAVGQQDQDGEGQHVDIDAVSRECIGEQALRQHEPNPSNIIKDEASDKVMENANQQVSMQPGIKSKQIVKDSKKSKIAKVSDQVKVTTSSSHECSICHRIFKKPQALGGHWSKAHPGESKFYQKKMEIRDERENEREQLNLAKAIL